MLLLQQILSDPYYTQHQNRTLAMVRDAVMQSEYVDVNLAVRR